MTSADFSLAEAWPIAPILATRERALAGLWLRDSKAPASTASVIKALDAAYQPDKRAKLKIKHVRSADCVVAGSRWHMNTTEDGPEAVG